MTKELYKKALQARALAKADYSNFKVGASVKTGSGKIYTGCNIESSSYGLTICAERVAIFKALSEGETVITEICVTADTKEPVSPCGACRQIIADYAEKAKIYLSDLNGNMKTSTVDELLPYHFKKEDFKNEK